MELTETLIPLALRDLDQWVVYRIEQREDGKSTKIPYQPRAARIKASSTNPDTWSTYEVAIEAVRCRDNNLDGVGFVFTAHDPYMGIDIDHCVADGVTSDAAGRIVDMLDSYAEYSPSGEGIHILVKASMPAGKKSGAIEMYSAGRYFTMTGRHVSGTPLSIHSRQPAVDALCAEYFPAPNERSVPSPMCPVPLVDTDLLSRAFAAANGDAVRSLYERGDLSRYGGDDSAADQALCNHLAFWTGNDASRMDALFRTSALMRSKWDETHGAMTYGAKTINKAIASTSGTYKPFGSRVPADVSSPDTGRGNPSPDRESVPESPASSPPVFPINAFPARLRAYCEEAAAATGVPVEFVAVPMLSFVGAAVGKRCEIVIKDRSWRESGALWTVIVAPAGAAKSPALELARVGIDAIQQDAAEAYGARAEQYDRDFGVWKSAPPASRGDPPNEPQPMTHYLTSDATPEALVELLVSSDGIVSISDELVGMLNSFDQYKSSGGRERQLYLSNWAGSAIKVDRKRGRPLIIPHPVVGITGGIQPGVLPQLLSGATSDGLIERFLWSYPEPVPARWTDDDVSAASRRDVIWLFRELGSARGEIRLSNKARARWIRWNNQNADLTIREMGLLAGMSAKMPRQVARLAMVLHVAEYAALSGDTLLSDATMAAAIEVAEYFREMGQRVTRCWDPEDEQRGSYEARILRAFRRFDVSTHKKLFPITTTATLTREEIRRALGGHLETARFEEALLALEESGELTHRRDTGTGGRPRDIYSLPVETSKRCNSCAECGQVLEEAAPCDCSLANAALETLPTISVWCPSGCTQAIWPGRDCPKCGAQAQP